MIDGKISSIIYLKNKLHKWKNIAIISIIFSIIISLKIIFGGSLNDVVTEGNFIAEVKIEGIILEDDYRSKILNKIAENKNIKAVIVNINSPGGGIVGSEILFNDLSYIASQKPIVVLMGSLAASGGYMAAIASDYIIAHNGTLTGSIGVLMESPQLTELADKIGIKFNSYKSSPLKGSPSPFEKPNFAINKVVNDSIKDSYQFFTELVLSKRSEKIAPNLRGIAFDGRFFTGRQALKVGLIDEIGGKKDAINYLQTKNIDTKKLEIKEIKVFEEKKIFLEKIFGSMDFLQDFNFAKSDKQIMAIAR
jgi:protease IV